jgi:hypothetical protein
VEVAACECNNTTVTCDDSGVTVVYNKTLERKVHNLQNFIYIFMIFCTIMTFDDLGVYVLYILVSFFKIFVNRYP